MSINAINSVSLYEYYYKINHSKPKAKPDLSAIVQKTDEEAEAVQKERKENRPWADLMYQLNLKFNDDPKDDITAINKELDSLIKGVTDEELEKEIADLKSYIDKLYASFTKTEATFAQSKYLENQLTVMSNINKMSLIHDTR